MFLMLPGVRLDSEFSYNTGARSVSLISICAQGLKQCTMHCNSRFRRDAVVARYLGIIWAFHSWSRARTLSAQQCTASGIDQLQAVRLRVCYTRILWPGIAA